MDAPTATAEPDALIFEATVKPYRSLSRRGILIVVGCMLAGSLTVTSLMALLGAWPVIGFNGADLMLAFLLLWLNIRAARAVETITLSQAALTVTRTDQRGRRTRLALPPYWLNPSLRERAGTVPRLILTTRDTEVEVARQLGDTEKRDLAAALTRALHRWRNPRFDNPQSR
jgi:uncharacterized membrane protein